MKVEIVGLSRVNYKKQDGSYADGYNVSYLKPLKEGEGMEAITRYLSSKVLPNDLRLGKAIIEFDEGFNKQAIVSEVTMINEK